MRHSIKPSTHVSKKSRAFHEAGHAVIARVEGIQITEATILPGFIQSERVLGSVEFIFGRTDDHEAKIRALLAGAIAQERAGFIDRIGGMQDRFEVEKLAGIWANRLKPGEFVARLLRRGWQPQPFCRRRSPRHEIGETFAEANRNIGGPALAGDRACGRCAFASACALPGRC